MEKYGQYRDKSTGIAPFFPIAPPPGQPILYPWYLFLFCVRVPLLIFAWLIWLSVLQWMPAGSILRKANQWCLLGIPGVWWIDLQVDGVRRGSLALGSKGRLPGPGTIIAVSCTSPVDILYLAAIFDPIFTLSQSESRLVRPVSIETALAACFSVPNPLEWGIEQSTCELSHLLANNPGRVIAVFPEGTTSNGRGILKLSPSLLSASTQTKIYPISLRYTPSDVVTPIPGWLEAVRFIWRLNSAPSHCIRVRIGSYMTMTPAPFASLDSSPTAKTTGRSSASENSFESNFFDTLQASVSQGTSEEIDGEVEGEGDVTASEHKLLDAVGEALARLSRVKRVDLGVEEKAKFVNAWTKGRQRKS